MCFFCDAHEIMPIYIDTNILYFTQSAVYINYACLRTIFLLLCFVVRVDS